MDVAASLNISWGTGFKHFSVAPMSNSRSAAALTSIPLLRDISPSASSLITDDMIHYFRTGEKILCEGDQQTSLVILLRGQARVIADGTYIVSRKAGEVIGEQAIVESTPRSATVVADGMVEALVLPPRIVQQLLDDAGFLRNLTKILSSKLREATSERSIRYRNEERLFGEFSAHVSPEIASRLLATGNAYGDPRFIHAAILMADIRSFTDRCARMEPRQIALELSHYLDTAVGTIHRHGGFVDKFIGDAVLAIWGVMPWDTDLAARALACAQEMVRTASTLQFCGVPIHIGVGLNVGQVFIGNVGGDGKRQFTVLGSPVNLAARFESECKPLAANIVAGQSFYDELSESARNAFHCHSGRFIKGAGELTVYAWSLEAVDAPE